MPRHCVGCTPMWPGGKEAVDLAEAGLIRFFEPAYNVQLKSTFPEDGHAVLRALNRFDLHAVAVELQAQHLGVLVGSGVTDPGELACSVLRGSL